MHRFVLLFDITLRWSVQCRTDVPQLVSDYLAGKLPIDHYITHNFHGVEGINEAIEALHSGNCLRAVVSYF